MSTSHIIYMVSFLCVVFSQNRMIAQQDNYLCQGNYWTEHEANLMMKRFAATWNDKESWEKRADTIRQGILDGLQFDKMPPTDQDVQSIIRDKRMMDGYSVSNIALESFPGYYLTGNLYMPLDLKGKNPAVICTHGHKSNRGQTENLQIRCATLARMGAVVFSLNSVGSGGLPQVEHHIPIGPLIQTWNGKKVLEYLISRPDVDPDNIAMTGESGGGTQTFLLAAIDDRLKVSVPVVQVSAHFFGGCSSESGMPIHRGPHHQTNNVEIAALCAPRPMLLISDGADWTKNTPIIEYPYIQRVYALYDSKYKIKNVHLPLEKHDYGYSKRAAAYVFLADQLGLDLDKVPYNEGFREDFVTILKFDELQIFNKVNPRPANALKGNEAVMDYLKIY